MNHPFFLQPSGDFFNHPTKLFNINRIEMNKIITTFLFSFIVFISVSQENMNYFLPDYVTYNKNIPMQEQFFGQQMGEWHLTHDQILYYMKEIARISGRAITNEYPRSWENRPLIQVIFTSVKNL